MAASWPSCRRSWQPQWNELDAHDARRARYAFGSGSLCGVAGCAPRCQGLVPRCASRDGVGRWPAGARASAIGTTDDRTGVGVVRVGANPRLGNHRPDPSRQPAVARCRALRSRRRGRGVVPSRPGRSGPGAGSLARRPGGALLAARRRHAAHRHRAAVAPGRAAGLALQVRLCRGRGTGSGLDGRLGRCAHRALAFGRSDRACRWCCNRASGRTGRCGSRRDHGAGDGCLVCSHGRRGGAATPAHARSPVAVQHV